MKLSGNTIDTAAAESAWRDFWFGDSLATQVHAGRLLAMVRLGLAVVAFWYFASHWSDIAFWFAGDGILSAQLLGTFLADADLVDSVQWRLSPLFWIDSPALLRGYLLVGMALAIALPLVRSTRAVAIALWLWAVWLANRSLMIGGIEEVTLAWGLGYLAISPASLPWPRKTGGDPGWCATGWAGSLAWRLMQLHISLVFLVTGLTMLSSIAWWDGTGVMAVVSPVESRAFDLTQTLRTPWIHETLTHAIALGAVTLPVLLWIRATRFVGFGLAILWCVGLAILSSQWMHFFSLAVLTFSFLPENWAQRIFLRTAA